MTNGAPARRGSFGLLALSWTAATTVFVIATFVYINGAFFSSVSALHIDLSINLTAAHAIREGDNPYGETVLLERAAELDSPTSLVYQSLFTSYIQPPTSALAVVPFSFLPWREATRAYLVLNNVLLAGAVVLTLHTVRPTIPLRWAIAGAALITAGFSQIYGSFALGQVDASVTFLLALALWAYSRGNQAVTGAAIAAGVAIKIIPVVLLLYFLWKREYRVAAWGLLTGLMLFLPSLPAAGFDAYWTYATDTIPSLLKGSTHYANVSIGGAFSRAFINEAGTVPPILSLYELPSNTLTRVLTTTTVIALTALMAAVIDRRRPLSNVSRDKAETPQAYVLEYYLVVAAGLLISSVTWEFYVLWLLPLFLACFLSPGRVLTPDRTHRLVLLVGLVVAYIMLNYPGDLYLFDVNSFFYHPEWVPGVWAEDRLQLYHHHLEIAPVLRLLALLFLCLVLSAAILEQRWRRPAASTKESHS